MSETNGQSRLDRIEAILESHSTMIVSIEASIERQERANEVAHERFKEEDKRLLTAQILMNAALEKTNIAVEKMGDGRLKVTGDLTINATTQEVVLDVEGPSPSIRDSHGNEKIGLSASTQISRKKFGLNWNEAMESGGVVVGDEVSITLDLELIKNTKPQVS